MSAADDVLQVFEDLFAGGPDTACRTTYHGGGAGSVECVELPIDDLRDALERARKIADQRDPLAIVDATQQFADQLRGSIAVLVADGWSDEHARLLVLHAVLQSRPGTS